MMAVCNSCGKKLPFLGGCENCRMIEIQRKKELDDANIIALNLEKDELRKAEEKKKTEIESIIVTTETSSNLLICNRIKVIVVARESAFAPKVVEMHDELLTALKAEAYTLGANAVVAVSFSVVEVMTAATGFGAAKTFSIIAYGTAVSIDIL